MNSFIFWVTSAPLPSGIVAVNGRRNLLQLHSLFRSELSIHITIFDYVSMPVSLILTFVHVRSTLHTSDTVFRGEMLRMNRAHTKCHLSTGRVWIDVHNSPKKTGAIDK